MGIIITILVWFICVAFAFIIYLLRKEMQEKDVCDMCGRECETSDNALITVCPVCMEDEGEDFWLIKDENKEEPRDIGGSVPPNAVQEPKRGGWCW